MNKFIFQSLILISIFFFLSGCYTYLSLSSGAKLAENAYELNYHPDFFPPAPPPHQIDPIFIPSNPSEKQSERTKEICVLRVGGEGRNIDNSHRRR